MEQREHSSYPVLKMLIVVFAILVLATPVFSQSDFCDPRNPNNPAAPPGQPTTFGRDICNFLSIWSGWVPIGMFMLVVFAALIYMFAQFAGAETRARAVVWANNIIIGVILAAVIMVVVYPIVRDVLLAGISTPPSGIPSMFDKIAAPILKFMALSFTVVGAFYMIAHFFQHPPFSAIAKEELAGAIYSAVIVWFWLASNTYIPPILVGLFTLGAPPGMADQLIMSSQNNAVSAHIYLAGASLDILFEKLRGMYGQLYFFEVLIGFLSTLAFPLGSPLPAVNMVTFTFMPYDGLVLLSNAHTVIVEAIGLLVAAIMSKQILLGLARDVVPAILLPLGIVMRTFPFTRKTGSSLIAISFVAFYVYPLAVLLSNYMIFDVYQPSDFTYVPKVLSPIQNADPENLQNVIDNINEEKGRKIKESFEADPLVDEAVESDCGTISWQPLCSAVNIVQSAASALLTSLKTVGHIMKFMWSMSYDFYTSMWDYIISGSPFSKLLPTSVTAGLYKVVIDEVVTLSQFIVLVIVTSLIEIIITITMYRNIAALIGGELEIAGLTKLV